MTASAKTASILLYPPEVRVHTNGEGQTLLLIATDDEGVSREVTFAEARLELADKSIASVEASRILKGNRVGNTRLSGVF